MPEELIIDASTGEQMRRELTEEQRRAAHEITREWQEREDARRADMKIVMDRAKADPAFAALLRVMGIPVI